VEKTQSKRLWEREETALFLKIMNGKELDSPKIEWKMVSYQLYMRSEGQFYRPFQKLREMWMNHLNPDLNKKPWTKE
jgi:hypothetical protein